MHWTEKHGALSKPPAATRLLLHPERMLRR